MSDKRLDSLITNLEKEVSSHNLTTLDKFTYVFMTFKFKTKIGQELQEKFVECLKELNDKGIEAIEIDLCNFFLANRVKFSIKFNYVKGMSSKDNFIMFKYLMKLKNMCLIEGTKANYKIEKYSKTFNNKGKDFKKYGVTYINFYDKIIRDISIDFNFLWKPKYEELKDDRGIVKDYSWLIFQYIKVIMK